MTSIKSIFQTVTPIAITCAIVGGLTFWSPVCSQTSDISTNAFIGRLKSGDRIRLTVTGFPDLSGEQIIMADGTLQLPLVGALQIAGLTPAQTVTTITEALRPYIRRPQVGLAVLTLRPSRISVTGEVLRPGPRLLVPPEFQQNFSSPPNNGGENFQTVSYALLLAGGITPNADIRSIIIRRSGSSVAIKQPSNTSPPVRYQSIVKDESNAASKQSTNPPNSEIKTEIKVNLWQSIQTGDLGSDIQIVDGDEIFVPTAQISRADQQRLLASTFSPAKITIQVAGQVQRPGPVDIIPTAGVSAAVAAAGGFTDKASQKSIALLRMTPEGRLEHTNFAFGQDSGPLRNGDVVVVSKSFFKSTLETLSSILNPISPLLFLLK